MTRFGRSLVSIMLAFAVLAGASAAQWSFQDNPPLPWESEKITTAQAIRAETMGMRHRSFCPGWVDGWYLAYQEHYPAFRQFADDPQMRRQWQMAFLRLYDIREDDCFAAAMFHELLDVVDDILADNPDVTARPVICNLTMPARFARYSRGQALLDDIRQLVRERIRLVLWSVDGYRILGSKIRFNHDIIYYVYLAARGMESRLGVGPIGSGSGERLTPQRRAFVETAVQRNDIDAVVATSAPCAGD